MEVSEDIQGGDRPKKGGFIGSFGVFDYSPSDKQATATVARGRGIGVDQ